MTTDAIIDEALRLDAERTPGEWTEQWRPAPGFMNIQMGYLRMGSVAVHFHTCDKDTIERNGVDLRFAAHAANNYAAMCRRVRELEAENERLTNRYHQQVKDDCDNDGDIRALCKPFMDVDGDKYGVPSIVDLVKSLATIATDLKSDNERLREAGRELYDDTMPRAYEARRKWNEIAKSPEN